ncbi:MAG: hypothetical protein PHE33_08365 [Bacteroidales bacterium]|nr:hypothetical protein [Bacteroidales bacterium]
MKKTFIIISFIILFLLSLTGCNKDLEYTAQQMNHIILINPYNYNLPNKFVADIRFSNEYGTSQVSSDITFIKTSTDTFLMEGPLLCKFSATEIQIYIEFIENYLYAKTININRDFMISTDTLILPISIGYPIVENKSINNITDTSARINYKVRDAGFSLLTETGIYLSNLDDNDFQILEAAYNNTDSIYTVNCNNLLPSSAYKFNIYLINEESSSVLNETFFYTLETAKQ